jgi:Na+/melibiose symporter-like transporter
MGFPLAFVALPLYVFLPNHYARVYLLPIAAIGALLLAARLLDAVIDPLIGQFSDRLFSRSLRSVLWAAAVAAMVLLAGFVMLFFPPVATPASLLLWVALGLVVTYSAFSTLSILYQSWGARLGGGEIQRSRVVAWREGMGLAGVIVASLALPGLGLVATACILLATLAGAWWSLGHSRAPRAEAAGSITSEPAQRVWPGLMQPLRRSNFRTLLAVFLANGIASAIPATLILFFVQDRLQAQADMEPIFLAAYFLSAALSVPLWTAGVARWGLVRCWSAGMVLSLAIFACAATLGAGDALPFLAICALSGIGLGADVVIPAALLAGVIGSNGDSGQREGAYFGWWNMASKLNLALAAGLTLPALGWLGYTPGTRSSSALFVLTGIYCLVPCTLKLLALCLLNFFLRKTS